jgi:DNA-binding YbaB/EbfC family protein
MGSFAKAQKRAQQNNMEEQIAQIKKQMKDSSFVGSSGNGLVTITLDGTKDVKSIFIKPECVDPNDVEGLQDLILAAFQDAASQAEGSLPF